MFFKFIFFGIFGVDNLILLLEEIFRLVDRFYFEGLGFLRFERRYLL